MVIKKATVEDSIELTKLRIEMRKERNEIIENIEEFYNNSLNFFVENIELNNFVAFVAIENNAIIATSGICFYSVPPISSIPNGKVAYLMNMYTVPAYRNKGIATKLLKHTMDEALERKCSKVSLSASDMGEPLYIKYGFKKVPSTMEFYF